MAKKNSGLPTLESMFSGNQAATDPAPPDPEPKPSAPAPPAETARPQPPPEDEEVVTSIRILKRTQINLHRLKSYELENGNRVKFGELIDEAIADLMKKKGVEASL